MAKVRWQEQMLRFASVLIGLALLGWLLSRTDAHMLAKQTKAVGWGLVLVIALGGVSHLIKTWAWRLTFLCDLRNLSFRRSFGLRLMSEGMGKLGIAGLVLGESTRVFLLGSSVDVSDSVSSVTLDRGLYAGTSALVSVAGIVSALVLVSFSATWRMYALLLTTSLLLVLIATIVAMQRRWPVLSVFTQFIGRLPWLRGWLSTKRSVIFSAESKLLQFCHEAPARFWGSVSLNLACHGLAILEVYLLLHFMGVRVSLAGAFVVEALTKLINAVGAVIPGNLGTYEGGNMIVAKLIGIGSATGLSLSLCRRVRSLFWSAIGASCILPILISNRRERRVSSVQTQPDEADTVVLPAKVCLG
jgi:Lysylphosphatidylglycerol synthase TM region